MTTVLGPVPLGSEFYVTRAFETSVKKHLLKRDWVLILGPRQHGKTSAFLRIQAEMTDTGFRCALVDLQNMPPVASYSALLRWFAGEVASSLGAPAIAGPIEREDVLQDWLAAAIPDGGTPVIILIDEASAVRDADMRVSFFGQIRAMKTAGAKPAGVPGIGPIQFGFAGTFRQEKMVDERNSPFNVSIRVETDDLGLEQVIELTKHAVGANETEIGTAIHNHVGGQPHLVQHMLSVLEEESAEPASDRIAAEFARLKQDGSDHLDALFRLVLDDEPLAALARKAATDGFADNDAANDDHRYMIAVGLLKREANRLVFRNRLYAEVARESTQLRPEHVPDAPQPQHLVSLGENAFQYIVDPEMREIATAAYNGGVAAYNQRVFRLALVGFGVCVEAMLLAWLSQRPVGDLATAVTAAMALPEPNKVKFNSFEDATKPESWRLVNLMRVGRQMNGVRGPIELPDALREMRNFVHPHVMKNAYMPEPDLQPEALAASAFAMAIRRDLS